jgi:hypothetical protein
MSTSDTTKHNNRLLFELPPDAGTIITRLNSIDARKLAQLSDRILERLPIDDAQSLFTIDERRRLVDALAVSSSDLVHILNILLIIWRQIAYHQLNSQQTLIDNLQSIGITDSIIERLVGVWHRSSSDVIGRLKCLSCSGLPLLTDIKCTLNVDVTSRDCRRIREPMMHLQLNNAVNIELNHEQLSAMFAKVQEIDRELNSLMS